MNQTAKPTIDLRSLMPSADRKTLYVNEVSSLLRVTDQHVIDLIKEGRMNGINVAGNQEYLRVSASAVDALAAHFNTDREVVLKLLSTYKAQRSPNRERWRVPVKEGYEAFLRENHSLTIYA